MSQPELSIVILFLNEEQVLPLLRERLEKIQNRPTARELLLSATVLPMKAQTWSKHGLSRSRRPMEPPIDFKHHGGITHKWKLSFVASTLNWAYADSPARNVWR
jgi:hypothetical protein